MTLFEYLAVSFSVVLSFAVVRILGGISDVFVRGRVYWVHAAWVIHLLFMIAYSWWRIWAYHDASWNLFTFLSVLAVTGLLYYQAATLVPAQSAGVDSWQAHFDAVRRPFFGAAIAWVVLVAINTHYVLGWPILHPSRISLLATIVISIVGIWTNRAAVQALLVVLMLLLWPLRTFFVLAFDASGAS